uniref:Uncharacterized protein n=1 Tax=Siphoviridae sp. ctzr51 TaxID=2825751 RepID=A0A8S5UN57_9CAUD|nr:MAG TPA: hypothetical protein [Siphoviridae sp. ctzr51]
MLKVQQPAGRVSGKLKNNRYGNKANKRLICKQQRKTYQPRKREFHFIDATKILY